MAIYSANPSELPKGAFWYVVPGKEPMICEKRDGEAFVRFTNAREAPEFSPGSKARTAKPSLGLALLA